MKKLTIKDAQFIGDINSMVIATRVACEFTQDEQRALNQGAIYPHLRLAKRKKQHKKEFKRLQKMGSKLLGKEVACLFFSNSINYKTMKRLSTKHIKSVPENYPFTWVYNRIQ